MSSNTITEIIETLGAFEIQDDKLAWKLKQLVDKLWLIEGVYDDLSSAEFGLSLQEQERYTREVFPSILSRCRKLSHYFTVCPELRRNEQDIDMLKTYFDSYGKIVDRLLVKLQKAQSVKRTSIFVRIGGWFMGLRRNVCGLRNIVSSWAHSIAHRFYFELPHWPFSRKTLVRYHRDSIDYVGAGYNLQPIQALSFEYA